MSATAKRLEALAITDEAMEDVRRAISKARRAFYDAGDDLPAQYRLKSLGDLAAMREDYERWEQRAAV